MVHAGSRAARNDNSSGSFSPSHEYGEGWPLEQRPSARQGQPKFICGRTLGASEGPLGPEVDVQRRDSCGVHGVVDVRGYGMPVRDSKRLDKPFWRMPEAGSTERPGSS